MQSVKDSLVLIGVGGVERDDLRTHFGILRHFSSIMLFRENGRMIVDIKDRNFQLCVDKNSTGLDYDRHILLSNSKVNERIENLSVDGVVSVRDANVEQIRRLLLPVEWLGDVNFAVTRRLHGEFITDISICQPIKTSTNDSKFYFK